MFTVVPPRYDLVNHIITLGQDRRWRRLAAQACLEGNPQRVLDLGCGTGDLTINIARLAEKDIEITGLDYSLPMLDAGTTESRQGRRWGEGGVYPRRSHATTLPRWLFRLRGDILCLPQPDL